MNGQLSLTLARNTDPATAHEAAQRARHNAATNSDRCLAAHQAAGEHGLNGDELADATGLPYQTIGPRRPALEAQGLIVKAVDRSGARIKRDHKQVYRATERHL